MSSCLPTCGLIELARLSNYTTLQYAIGAFDACNLITCSYKCHIGYCLGCRVGLDLLFAAGWVNLSRVENQSADCLLPSFQGHGTSLYNLFVAVDCMAKCYLIPPI